MSDFQSFALEVLGGRLPLYEQLTRAQRRAGKSDCAIVLVGDDYPGCVGMFVASKGLAHVVVSYSALCAEILWGEFDGVSPDQGTAMLDEFALHVKRLSEDKPGPLFTTDVEHSMELLQLATLAGAQHGATSSLYPRH